MTTRPAGKRKIIGIPFRPEVHREIKRRADAMDMSMAAWVRQLVGTWLDNQPRESRRAIR